ncbi:MAG: sensor histidine kinase [Chlorobiaceae bacterium]
MKTVIAHTPQQTLLAGIFLLLALLFSPQASAAPLQLGGRSAYDLAGHMELLKDPSLSLGFTDVLKAAENGRFHPLDANLNNGYKREACWVRFTIERNASFPEKGWLRLKPNYINYLTLYIQTPGHDPSLASSYHIVRLGNHIPALQRPVLHPDFVVPLVLPASAPVIIYARVFSNSSISLAGNIHTTEDLRDYTNLHVILQSAFLGIGLTLLVINTIFYISTRDTLFLYYSLYVLAGIIFNFAAEGVMTLLFPSVVHQVSDYLIYGGIGANILVYSEFSRKLFFSVAGSWSLRYMRFLSLLGFLTMAAVPLGFYPLIAPLAFIGTLTLVVIQLILSVRLRAQLPSAGIFIVVAFAVSSLGYFHMLLRLMGIIPLGFLWDMNTVQFTTIFHITLISIALSRRVLMAERVLTERFQQELNIVKETEKKALALACDMTQELRKSKEMLEVAFAAERQALDQQHRFLSMLSHEYRTPLAVISGNIDIIDLQEERGKQSGYDEELSAMHRAVDRLVEVMDVSLERSRLTEPGITEGIKPIAMVTFLSAQVTIMRTMWPLRTFTYCEASDIQTILGDPQTIKTALFNLLENARKYSPPSSTIDVESHIEEDEVVITIQNQGKIFTNQEGEEFFDKYTRGVNSNDTSGAGVGLWLVRHIIEQHNGVVSLTATASGIRATVRIPLAYAACEPLPENSSVMPTPARL